MASEKTLYWMAVGLAAITLGTHFANRYDGRCLAERSLAAARQVSGEATRFMVMAGVVLDKTFLPLERTESDVARLQNRIATVNAVVARQQAVCARLEVRRMRVMALQQVQQIHVQDVCPRPALQLSLPKPMPSPRDGTI